MNKVRIARFGATLAITWVVAFMGGCAKPDPLVSENFSRIHKSTSTRADVQALLGEPDQRFDDSQWMYQRPDRHLHVFIDFDEKGYVTRTQWIDGMGETWQDSKDSSKDKDGENAPAGNSTKKISTSSKG